MTFLKFVLVSSTDDGFIILTNFYFTLSLFQSGSYKISIQRCLSVVTSHLKGECRPTPKTPKTVFTTDNISAV